MIIFFSIMPDDSLMIAADVVLRKPQNITTRSEKWRELAISMSHKVLLPTAGKKQNKTSFKMMLNKCMVYKTWLPMTPGAWKLQVLSSCMFMDNLAFLLYHILIMKQMENKSKSPPNKRSNMLASI